MSENMLKTWAIINHFAMVIEMFTSNLNPDPDPKEMSGKVLQFQFVEWSCY